MVAVAQPSRQLTSHDPPPVGEQISGTFKIDPATFARKLGRPAFDVFTALQFCRSFYGFTHVSNAKLAELVNRRRAREDRAPMSPRMLRKSTARLCSLGLFGMVGKKGRTRVVRRLVGDYRRSIVRVPRDVAMRILNTCTRGGRRAGAGRPRKNQKGQAWQSKGGIIISSGEQTNPVDSRGLHDVEPALRDRIRDPSDLSLTEKANRRQPDVESVSKKTKGDSLRPAVKARRDALRSKVASMVTRDAYEEARHEQVEPPYPSTKVLRVAKLPDPRCLPDSMSDAQCAGALAKLYRGAIERKYDAPCFLFSKGEIRDSKHYRTLVRAAHTMRDLSIEPAAWICFAFDMWRMADGRRDMIPPIGFVFKTDRMVQRVGWFRRQQHNCKGGRLTFNKAQKEVMRRYNDWDQETCRTVLDVERADEQRRELVDKHFPGGWASYYDVARARGEEDQIELWKALDDHEYLWE